MATLFGDTAGILSGNQQGGNQTLNGVIDQDNTLHGDAQSLIDTATGGNDNLTGGSDTGGADSTNFLFGESVSMAANSKGGNDTVIGGVNSGSAKQTNTLHGEALSMAGFARGGNDVVSGGNNTGSGGSNLNNFHGDSSTMVGSTVGGDDVVNGGSNSGSGHVDNFFYGDAFSMANAATSGDDTVGGGVNNGTGSIANTLHGDASLMTDTAASGDDVVVGGNNTGIGSVENVAYGDAFSMTDAVTSGDDQVIGGSSTGTGTINNALHGDASLLSGTVQGGDDTLVGGSKSGGGSVVNTLYGDAFSMSGSAKGGDDRLSSGLRATDHMFGDAHFMSAGNIGGTDTFIFSGSFGVDFVHDFHQSEHDQLEFHVSGVNDPNDLDIQLVGGDTVINASPEDRVTLVGFTAALTPNDFVFPSQSSNSTSYVLFGRSSLVHGERDDWIGSAGANSKPNPNPLNSARSSSFNADVATTAGTVLAGSAAADYAADGVLTKSTVAMFNLTEAPPGTFATGAAADLTARVALGTPLFGAPNTRLDAAHSEVDLPGNQLHLALTDQNWNGIKNLEIKLGSDTSLRDIRLENFVDTRLKLGDSPPDSLAPSGPEFDVKVLGIKRGEIDASEAPQAVRLLTEVWTNSETFQNSIDIKGSVFADAVKIRAGAVAGSQFGEDGFWYVHPPFNVAPGTYFGVFTTIFANLGAGSDQFDSTETIAVGPIPFTERSLETRDIVWGGTGDDTIDARGFADGRLYGDNGSGTDFNPDPASALALVDDDFINEPIVGATVPTFTNGPINLGTLVDMGAYTISAVGGDLLQLKTGLPATRAGGLGILSPDDPINSLADVEIDSRGGPEAIVLDFKGGAHSVELELTALYHESFTLPEGFSASIDEQVVYEVFLSDGTSFTDTASRGGPNVAPGLLTILIDLSSAGGPLIDTIRLTPFIRPEDGNFVSDFYLSTVRARALTSGEAGNDTLLGGSFADWLEGNGDRGVVSFVISEDPNGEPLRLLDTSTAGDVIHCGTIFRGKPFLDEVPDTFTDTVNFNEGDGFDKVFNFGAGDILRIENVGSLTIEVIDTTEQNDGNPVSGTLVQNGAGSVFLVGVTTPLSQSIEEGYLLLS